MCENELVNPAQAWQALMAARKYAKLSVWIKVDAANCKSSQMQKPNRSHETAKRKKAGRDSHDTAIILLLLARGCVHYGQLQFMRLMDDTRVQLPQSAMHMPRNAKQVQYT